MVDEPLHKKIPPPPPPGSAKTPSKMPPPPPPGVKLPPKGEIVSPTGRPPILPQRNQGSTPRPPGIPPGSHLSSRDLEDKLRKMEDQTQEMEESKKKLERTLIEMEQKLKEEKEKALYQAIKAREEESLSLKMEQSLKEMQDKSRLARREQELDESRLRAEEKVKELERRLNEERETWVINLKKQMEMRDSDTQEVESQIESRFREIERRWFEEKAALTQGLKAKEDELIQIRAESAESQTIVRRAQEESSHIIELAKKKMEGEMEVKREEFDREKRYLKDKLDAREREQISLKAHLSMVDSQVRAAQESSIRNLQEKEHSWEKQLSELQKDLSSLRQVKDQAQTDLTRANAEASSFRKEIGEWERKFNLSEQRIQELKISTSQLQDENRKKTSDYEFAHRKLDEQILTEKSVRESLAMREKEFGFMMDRQQELVKQREKDLADLKVEYASLEGKLERRYEKEKNTFIETASIQLQEEIAIKAELTQRELTQIRESVINELSELDEEIKMEKSSSQSLLTQRERELNDALSAMKELQKELMDERNRYNIDLKKLKDTFEADRQSTLETVARKQEQLKKATEEKDAMAEILLKQKSEQEALQADRNLGVDGQSADSFDHLTLTGRLWKYLTRTVVVISLRGVPRIKRTEEAPGMLEGQAPEEENNGN